MQDRPIPLPEIPSEAPTRPPRGRGSCRGLGASRWSIVVMSALAQPQVPAPQPAWRRLFSWQWLWLVARRGGRGRCSSGFLGSVRRGKERASRCGRCVGATRAGASAILESVSRRGVARDDCRRGRGRDVFWPSAGLARPRGFSTQRRARALSTARVAAIELKLSFCDIDLVSLRKRGPERASGI